MSDSQGNPQKSIQERLSAALSQLSTDQIRFVVARQEFSTDKEAAENIGIKPDTVYRWPEVVKEAVQLMAQDGLVTAIHLRKRNLAKAMLVKVGGLDSRDDKIAQGVATEIIEWEMGKAAQSVEINIDSIRDELAHKLNRITATVEEAEIYRESDE